MDDDTLAQHHWMERLRATIRYEVGVLGRRRTDLAKAMQVAPAALRTLLCGGVPSPTHLRGIEAYCTEGVVEDAYPEQAALSALVARMPPACREETRRLMVHLLRTRYKEQDVPDPAWITYERAGRIITAPPCTIPLVLRRAASQVLVHGSSKCTLPEGM